jgi:hypothetical protein
VTTRNAVTPAYRYLSNFVFNRFIFRFLRFSNY